jgi:hypothetical protein
MTLLEAPDGGRGGGALSQPANRRTPRPGASLLRRATAPAIGVGGHLHRDGMNARHFERAIASISSTTSGTTGSLGLVYASCCAAFVSAASFSV